MLVNLFSKSLYLFLLVVTSFSFKLFSLKVIEDSSILTIGYVNGKSVELREGPYLNKYPPNCN